MNALLNHLQKQIYRMYIAGIFMHSNLPSADECRLFVPFIVMQIGIRHYSQ